MFHVLQCLHMYVANLCSKCFIYFQTHVVSVFLWMLQKHICFSNSRVRVQNRASRTACVHGKEQAGRSHRACARATKRSGRRVKWSGCGVSFSPCLVGPQISKSCYSTCHIECLRPVHGALNVNEKKLITQFGGKL